MPQQKNNVRQNDDSSFKATETSSSNKNKAKNVIPESVLESEIEEKLPFLERWKTSRFFLLRGIYYVLYSVWMIVVVVGGFIAWLISLLFI